MTETLFYRLCPQQDITLHKSIVITYNVTGVKIQFMVRLFDI